MKPSELVADLMCRIDNVACQADPIIDQRIIKCKKQDNFLRAIRTNQPMFYDVHNSITHSDDPDAALRLAIEYERQQENHQTLGPEADRGRAVAPWFHASCR